MPREKAMSKLFVETSHTVWYSIYQFTNIQDGKAAQRKITGGRSPSMIRRMIHAQAEVFAYHKREAVHNCTALVLYCRHNSHIWKSESSVREKWEPPWGRSGQSTATTSCSATLEGPKSYRILCEEFDLMPDPAQPRMRFATVMLCSSRSRGPQLATPFPTPDRWTGRYLSVA